MIDRACGIINVVVCNEDFLRGIVNPGKSGKFPFIRLVLRDAVCHLHQIQLSALDGAKVNLPASMPINRDFISPIGQLIQHNVFKIVRQVIANARKASAVSHQVFILISSMNIPEPGNRESGETETAIPVKRKP